MKHTVDSVYLSAPKEVVGTYGGSVKVTCRYNLRFRDYTKYWCKGRVYDLCHIVVKTPRNRLSDRSSITDNKMAGAFTITTTSLRDSDDDVYWCVIATSGKNVNTRVRLRISHTGMTHTGYPTLWEYELPYTLYSPFYAWILSASDRNLYFYFTLGIKKQQLNVLHITILFYFNNYYFYTNNNIAY